MQKKASHENKTNTLEENILDERINAKGNPARTSMFLHQNKKTKDNLIRLASSRQTKNGKWTFGGGTAFFLTIKQAIKFIKGLLSWSEKYDIDLSEIDELKRKPVEDISKELRETRIALEKYKKMSDDLALELSKREDEFKKSREDEFKGKIDEYKAQIKEFSDLIENFEKNESKEGDLQSFLESHPWFLGLYYKDFTPQKITGMGRFDFYLRRFDDSEEIIELKRVDVNFMNADENISADFAQALDQMLRYFDEVQAIASSTLINQKLNIHEFYPRGILIFGFKPNEKTKAFINKWKNGLKLEINTYDQILEKFKVTIQNLEKKIPAK